MGTGGTKEAKPFRRRRGGDFHIEREYERHIYMFVQHCVVFLLFFWVFVFVIFYQASRLKRLTLDVSEGDYLDPWLYKWTGDYIDGATLYQIYVTIGCTITGIGSIGALLGFISFVYRPMEKAHVPATVGELFFAMLLFGFGLPMYIYALYNKLIFNGDDDIFFRVVEGDPNDGDPSEIDPVDMVPFNTSAYCSDTMHPSLGNIWSACPAHYEPAVTQVQTMIDSGEYTDRTARQALGNVTFCTEVGVCPGCNEAGAACASAVRQTVLLAQEWDGFVMWVAASCVATMVRFIQNQIN